MTITIRRISTPITATMPPIVAIATLEIIDGSLPRRAKMLTIEWALEYRDELLEDWRLAEQHLPLKKIKPLE